MKNSAIVLPLVTSFILGFNFMLSPRVNAECRRTSEYSLGPDTCNPGYWDLVPRLPSMNVSPPAYPRRRTNTPTYTEPQQPSYYAAFAYSKQVGEFGYSWGAPTQSEAENSAIQSCRASDCRVVLWYRDAFGVIARAKDFAWGSAWGNTLKEAERAAIQACKQVSKTPETCKVIVLKHANG